MMPWRMHLKERFQEKLYGFFFVLKEMHHEKNPGLLREAGCIICQDEMDRLGSYRLWEPVWSSGWWWWSTYWRTLMTQVKWEIFVCCALSLLLQPLRIRQSSKVLPDFRSILIDFGRNIWAVISYIRLVILRIVKLIADLRKHRLKKWCYFSA